MLESRLRFPSTRVRHALGWAGFAKRVRCKVEVKLHEGKLATRTAGKQGSGVFVLRSACAAQAGLCVSARILRIPRREGFLVKGKTKKYEVGGR